MTKNIYVIGVFDLFHVGHLNHIKYAKNLSPDSKVIVGIQDDPSVKDCKRETLIPDSQRKQIVESLEMVDQVIFYSDLNQINNLKKHEINIFTVGPEYTKNPFYQEMMNFCKKNEIVVKVIPRTKDVSTTNIIKKCLEKGEHLVNTAKTFWKSHETYPTYSVPIEERRKHEVKYLLPLHENSNSVLDLGCGDGSLVKILHEKTKIEKFYAYELSENLLKNLDLDDERIEKKVIDLTNTNLELPEVDSVIFAGVVPFLFKDSEVLSVLEKLKTKKLFLRAPCTLKEEDELVDTFSKELGQNYTAIYRTRENLEKLVSKYFKILDIINIYPDEIESKFGTVQYYFRCEKS